MKQPAQEPVEQTGIAIMIIKKEELIKAARTYIGTEFKHQGRIKKNRFNNGGVDCLGLLMCIAKELNIGSGLYNKKTNKEIPLTYFDDKEYTISSSPSKLIEGFNRVCIKIDNLSFSKIGDILLIKYNNLPKHLAIISNIEIINNDKVYYIIHSYIMVGSVVEHILNEEFKNNIYGIYRLRNIR